MSSLHCAANTLCLGYKNQFFNVTQGNSCYYEILTTHRNTFCGKNVGLLNVETVGNEFNHRALKFLMLFSVAQNVECQYDWQLSELVIRQPCYVQLCHLLSGRTSPRTIL